MSIKDTFKSTLIFLKDQQQNNFSSIPLERVTEFTEPLKIYKENIGKDDLYSEYKTEIKKLRSSKLHLRIIDIIKEFDKKDQRLPILFYKKLPQDILIKYRTAKLNKKSHLQELEHWLIKTINPTSPAVHLAQEFKWGHGTNSSMLTLLKELDFTLIPTGEMLQRGVAPMSGELTSGGLITTGVNQSRISAVPIEDIAEAWNNYANQIQFHFPVEKYEDLEPLFLSNLESLTAISPDDHTWDVIIISLIRAKQWNPNCFEDLCLKYNQKIEELKEKTAQKCSYREHSILKALDWDLEDLRLACTDEGRRKSVEMELGIESETVAGRQGNNWYDDNDGITSLKTAEQPYLMNHIDKKWETIVTVILKARIYGKPQGSNEFERQLFIKSCEKTEQTIRNLMKERIQMNMIPFENRYRRLLNAFDSPSSVQLSATDRDMITSPFPILFASTKTKATTRPSGSEIVLECAQLGKDIDLVFVKPENLKEMHDWLKQYELHDKVKVYSSEHIQEMTDLPLQHSSDQVIDHRFLSKGL